MEEHTERKDVDCIEEVEVVKRDGEIKKYKKSDLIFKYRTTEIKQNKWIVVSALFKFGRGFDKECAMDKYAQRDEAPIGFTKQGTF